MTMRERYMALTEQIALTEEHHTDYAHLQRCWEGDPDVLSAWEMRYLYELEPRLSPAEQDQALARYGTDTPWIELSPGIERVPPDCTGNS